MLFQKQRFKVNTIVTRHVNIQVYIKHQNRCSSTKVIKSISLKLTWGLLDSSAELATASNPTYAKKTTVAPVNIDFKPFGAKGDQFETSTSKAPTIMTKMTMIICSKSKSNQPSRITDVKYIIK